jgi:hypothetical protein
MSRASRRSSTIRFRDQQWTVHHFTEEFLVRCPRCDAGARVIPFTANQETGRTWRVVCSPCGYVRDKDPRCSHWHSGRGASVIRDPYFDLPLLLQASCCGGKLLWAYNLEHLAFLEAFVAAHLRERSDAVRAGDGYRRMSMIAKLPAWLKARKNRDEILAKIERLRGSAENR